MLNSGSLTIIVELSIRDHLGKIENVTFMLVLIHELKHSLPWNENGQARKSPKRTSLSTPIKIMFSYLHCIAYSILRLLLWWLHLNVQLSWTLELATGVM